ncbi:hypothetical protein B7494_g3338 [Chlorociboria aeruginascens]|nr:hypothetical protein B7494_g3338 [Chlorociboria aeruginascens]
MPKASIQVTITMGLGSKISSPVPNLFRSSSISTIDGWRCIIALIVVTGEEELEINESLLLDIPERVDADEERRRDERMLEKDSDGKR